MRKIIILLLLLLVSDLTQASIFGKNKVRYKKFNWKVLQTENFEIYFEPQIEDLAKITANFAETAYEYLSSFFEYHLYKKIPIILFKSVYDFQQTNIILDIIEEGIGGFAEIYKYRIVLPFSGSFKELKETLTHELCHIFCFSLWYKGMELGKLIRVPLFFEEGLAEYLSKKRLSSIDKTLLINAIINNYLIPISKLGNIYNLEFPYLAYKESQNFIRFLIEEYSTKEKFLSLVKNLKGQDFTEVFKKIYKESLEEVEKKWILWLRKNLMRYFDKDFPELIGEAITEGRVFAITPAGEVLIVFNEDKQKIYSISIKEHRIITNITKHFKGFEGIKGGIDVSADGEKIVFIAKKQALDWLIIYNILTKEIEDKIKVNRVDFINSVDFHPNDSNKLLICGVKNGKSVILLYDTNNPKFKVLKIASGIYEAYEKAIYLTSDKIVLAKENNFSHELVLYHKLSNNNWQEEVLVEGLKISPNPEKTTNQNSILFISDIGDLPNIYCLNLEDKSIRKLTNFIIYPIKTQYIDTDTLVLSGLSDKSFKIYKVKPLPDTYHYLPTSLFATEKSLVYNESIKKTKLNFSEYIPKLTLDWRRLGMYYSSAEGFSAYAELAASDILGNHRFLFNSVPSVYEAANFILLYSYLEKKPTFDIGLFNIGYPYYSDYQKYYKKIKGGFLFVECPKDKFHRHEFGLMLRQETEYPLKEGDITKEEGIDELSYSFVIDTARWRRFGIISGTRARFTLEKTIKLIFNNQDFFNLKFDLRKYLRISDRTLLSTRFVSKNSFGGDKRMFEAGGVSVLPYLVESEDLRGYKYGEFRSDKLFLFSLELRFPFIDELRFALPLSLSDIRGVFFFEGASINPFSDFNYSVGFGIRSILGGLPLRIDYAWQTDLRTLSKEPTLHISLGYDF